MPKIDETLQYAAFKDMQLTKEQIRENLQNDIKGVAVTIIEVLQSPQCLDALADIYYARFLALKEKEEKNG